MDYEKWEPYYKEILDDMGFSGEDDEKSTLFISEAKNAMMPEDAGNILRKTISGKLAIVCGNSPGLPADAEKIKDLLKKGEIPENEEDFLKNGEIPEKEKRIQSNLEFVIIAADGAAAVLSENGIRPDIIVTDLDGKKEGDVDEEIRLANTKGESNVKNKSGKGEEKGTLILIHAHGNNREALEKYIPETKMFIATCQCRPIGKAVNFGGFSDGDRCIFLADEFDAAEIRVFGFDLSDSDVTEIKLKKLAWAKKLIGVLKNEKLKF